MELKGSVKYLLHTVVRPEKLAPMYMKRPFLADFSVFLLFLNIVVKLGMKRAHRFDA